MVTVARGEIWWASWPEPTGSGPGYRRPVVIVQGDHLNRSKLQTVGRVPLTSNLAWAEAPGNVLLTTSATGLPKDLVANASRLVAVDRELLTERFGRLSASNLWLVLSGIDVVLGR